MKNIILFLLPLLVVIGCKEKTNNASTSIQPEKKEIDFQGLYQYYHASPSTLEEREENQIIEYAVENKMSVERTRSGIYIANHTVGAGDSIKWGDPVKVHYRGYFLDGKEFDSSLQRGEPISFRVGSMVPGWNEALPFLRDGSVATFLIPSHMGYGKRGFEGYVPPDKIIAFDIEVLEVGKKKK